MYSAKIEPMSADPFFVIEVEWVFPVPPAAPVVSTPDVEKSFWL